MAENTREKIAVFVRNGIPAEAIVKRAEYFRSQGLSSEQIKDKLNAAYNKLIEKEKTQAQQPKNTQESIIPQPQKQSYIGGALRGFGNELLLGGGNILAGVTNVPMTYLARLTTRGERPGRDLRTGEEIKADRGTLNPVTLFREGRKDFAQQQEEFAEQSPFTAGTSRIAGTVAGLLLPGGAIAKGVGGAVRGAKVASKLPAVAREGLALTAGEAASFGTYSAIKQGAENTEELRLQDFAKGAAQGAAVGGALGYVNRVTSPLTTMALNRLAMKEGIKRRIAQGAANTLLEGAAQGIVPAAIEGEVPSIGDITAGVVATGALKGGAFAFQNALSAGRKWATAPTKIQKAEAEARIQKTRDVENTKTAIDQGKAKLLDLRNANKELKAQLNTADATAKADLRSQIKQNNEQIKGLDKEIKYQNRYLQAEQAGITKRMPGTVATKQDIEAVKKADANIKNDLQAQIVGEQIIGRSNIQKANAKEKLPLLERTRRTIQGGLESARTTFDVLRPLKAAEERFSRYIGNIQLKDSPALTLEELRAGGKTQAELSPLADLVNNVSKKDEKAIIRSGALLANKKATEMGKGRYTMEQLDEAFANDKNAVDIANSSLELNQKALDALRASGRIDEEFYQQLKQNQNYVPSVKIKDGADAEDIVSSFVDNRFKKYEGTQEVYENPVISTINHAKAVFNFAQKEQAKKQAINMLRKLGEATKVEGNFSAGTSLGKNQIDIWNNGRREIWNIPENIAEIFKPKIKTPDTLATKILKGIGGKFMNLFKGATTAGSLGFSLVNPVRDIQSVLAGSKAAKYVGAEDFSDAYKTVTSANKRQDPLYIELEKAIGQRGTLIKAETFKGLSDDAVKTVRNALEAAENAQPQGSFGGLVSNIFTQGIARYGKKFGGLAGKFGKKSAEALTFLGNASEEAARLTAFKGVLKSKAKDTQQYNEWLKKPKLIPQNILKEAGQEAREVTLNFNRQMAPWVETANKYMIPYFKPAILGTMRGWEVLSNPEVSGNAWKFISNLGIMQGLINARIADEEDIKNYEDFNNDIANKNLVLQGDNGKIYTFPLAQEFVPIIKIFSAGAEKIARQVKGTEREDIAREAKESFKDLLLNYTPLISTVSPSNFSPGILKPALEQYIGKNLYSNTPIETQTNRPPEQRYTRSTSLAARVASQKLADTGIGLSPQRIDHLIKSFTSSTGKEIMPIFDSALRYFGVGKNVIEMKKEMTDNPIFRRFVQSANTAYSQTNMDARDFIKKNKNYYSYVRTNGLQGLSEKQKETYRQGYRNYAAVKPIDDALNKLYKQEAKIANAMQKRGNKLAEEYKQGKITKSDFEAKKEKYALDLTERIERLEELKLRYNRRLLEIVKEKKLK